MKYLEKEYKCTLCDSNSLGIAWVEKTAVYFTSCEDTLTKEKELYSQDFTSRSVNSLAWSCPKCGKLIGGSYLI